MKEKAYCASTMGAVADYLYQQLGLHPAQGHYRLQSATSGPRILTVNMIVNPSLAKKLFAMADELSMAAGLDRHEKIRIDRGRRGTLAIEIPKPEDLWHNIGVRALPPPKVGLKISLGIDGEHRPSMFDFGDPLTPHLLTAGTTGCGKTNAARLLVYDLTRSNPPDAVQLLLVNVAKPWNWNWFEGLAHLAHPVIADDTDALRALSWAVSEMDRRGRDGRHTPHIFLIVDEAQALLDRKEFVGMVSKIAAVGRELGVHLVLCTQNPTSAMLGDPGIKRNMTARLVGKVPDPQTASIAAGIAQTNAERLTAAGDNLLITHRGVKRITTALITRKDTEVLPRCEQVARLALEEYEDPDHVLAQSENRLASVQPEHVATALAYQRGITWLAGELNIGAKRATRVKHFADRVAVALENLGYSVIPHTRIGCTDGVTGDSGRGGV